MFCRCGIGDWSALTMRDLRAPHFGRLIIQQLSDLSRRFDWVPGPRKLNCLIGPGRIVERSSILDAIDLCVGLPDRAARSATWDFFRS